MFGAGVWPTKRDFFFCVGALYWWLISGLRVLQERWGLFVPKGLIHFSFHCADSCCCFHRDQKLHFPGGSGSRVDVKQFACASRGVWNIHSSHQLGTSQKLWCSKGWGAPQLAKAKLQHPRIQTQQNETGRFSSSQAASTFQPEILGATSDPSAALVCPVLLHFQHMLWLHINSSRQKMQHLRSSAPLSWQWKDQEHQVMVKLLVLQKNMYLLKSWNPFSGQPCGTLNFGTLWVKNFFLTSNPNLSSFSLKSSPPWAITICLIFIWEIFFIVIFITILLDEKYFSYLYEKKKATHPVFYCIHVTVVWGQCLFWCLCLDPEPHRDFLTSLPSLSHRAQVTKWRNSAGGNHQLPTLFFSKNSSFPLGLDITHEQSCFSRKFLSVWWIF